MISALNQRKFTRKAQGSSFMTGKNCAMASGMLRKDPMSSLRITSTHNSYPACNGGKSSHMHWTEYGWAGAGWQPLTKALHCLPKTTPEKTTKATIAVIHGTLSTTWQQSQCTK